MSARVIKRDFLFDMDEKAGLSIMQSTSFLFFSFIHSFFLSSPLLTVQYRAKRESLTAFLQSGSFNSHFLPYYYIHPSLCLAICSSEVLFYLCAHSKHTDDCIFHFRFRYQRRQENLNIFSSSFWTKAAFPFFPPLVQIEEGKVLHKKERKVGTFFVASSSVLYWTRPCVLWLFLLRPQGLVFAH